MGPAGRAFRTAAAQGTSMLGARFSQSASDVVRLFRGRHRQVPASGQTMILGVFPAQAFLALSPDKLQPISPAVARHSVRSLERSAVHEEE